MTSPAVASGIFESLPPRPPTPPRETKHESSLQTNSCLGSADSRGSLHTPPSAYTTESIDTGSSRRASKRVDFSGKAEYRDPPVYRDGEIEKHRPTPISLPSSSSKPIKSILKQTSYVANPSNLHPQTSFTLGDDEAVYDWPTMLESAMQHLAGSDRDSKIDAYMMLTRVLKESNDLLNRVRIHEQIHLFLQFVQRDISTKTDGSIESNKLAVHALALLNTFLRLEGIAREVYQDPGGCALIVDHCIRCFEDGSVAKDVTRHLMQVMVNQNFPSKVMSSDRVGRLISALHNIEAHHTGKSIIQSRVIIYRKLVRQAKTQMISHSDWLFDLFTDMLSNIKDIRANAIHLGLEAAFGLSQDRPLSRRVMDIMKLIVDEQKYIEYYRDRLKDWVRDKQQTSAVPRIWSVVVLLLRCPSFDKWEFFSDWLMIMQSCFNSGDFQTRIEANYAWNRLVYLALMDERIIPDAKKRMNILSRPLCDQLTRKSSSKYTDELRTKILGGACNLFYYAFKPSVNLAFLDCYWDNGVHPLLAQLISHKPDDRNGLQLHATRILTGLFDNSRSRIWKEDRVIDNPVSAPEELPAIEPKWIRRNTSRVFAVVEPILRTNFLELGNTKSATFKLWRTLVSSIATAASKEIKVSIETAAFLAEALNVVRKIWMQGLSSAGEAEAELKGVIFLDAARAYLQVMMSALRTLPFTEKTLATDKRSKFVPVSTPSHRTSKSQSHPQAPLYHLFAIFSSLPANVPDDDVFANFIRSIFNPFFETKGTHGQAELAQDLLSSLPLDTTYPFGPWLLAAEKTYTWLDSRQLSRQSTFSDGEDPVGHQYREVVHVLERGIRSMPGLSAGHWNTLFGVLCERVRSDSGDAGVAMLVLEPLAEVIHNLLALQGPPASCHGYLKYSNALLSVATQPRDRLAVDAARRRLWSTAVAGSKPPSFDTFDNLYRMSNSVLEVMYRDFQTAIFPGCADLIRELKGFLDRSNRALAYKTIILLQHGICNWIKDTKRVLGPHCSDVLAEVTSLWDKLTSLLLNTEKPEQQLDALEPLLTAALTSSHRSIQNITVNWWNKLLANVEEIQYPAQLKPILISMRRQTSLYLPGLEATPEELSDVQPHFVDTKEAVETPRIASAMPSGRAVRPLSTVSRSSSPVTPRSSTAQRIGKGPPKAALKKSRLLRHEDSQLQFAPVESSLGVTHVDEFQLLTEHQKEVRDRQRENAALFPECRSSPELGTKAPDHSISSMRQNEQFPKLPRASTPEFAGTYDDYVSSTPTPRRGQLVLLPEHDLGDPPSSPPEPRGNPLAAEIRSRSASNSLRDEWQLSSSPVSPSPSPDKRPSTSSVYQDDTFGGISLPAEHYEQDENLADGARLIQGDDSEPIRADEVKSDSHKGLTDDGISPTAAVQINPETETAYLVEDSEVADIDVESQQQGLSTIVSELPTTPQRLRITQQEESPASDNDVFVDARSSPAAEAVNSPLPTPKRSERIANRVKSSPLKFVVEVDGSGIDRSDYRIPTESPEKKDTSPEKKNVSSKKDTSSEKKNVPTEQNKAKANTLDCIVVGDSPESTRRRGRGSRNTRFSLIPIPATTDAASETPVATSSQSRGRGRPKRKRADSHVEESGGKRRRSRELNFEGLTSSQASPVQDMITKRLGDAAVASSPLGNPVQNSPVQALRMSESQIPEEILESYVNDSIMDLDSPTPAMQEEMVQSQIESESHSQDGNVHEVTPSQPVHDQHVDAGAVNRLVVDARPAETESDMTGSRSQPPANQELPIAPAVSKAQMIMDALRIGQEALRTANVSGDTLDLSRDDVYMLEDMLMDVKRDLHAAEKRGRI